MKAAGRWVSAGMARRGTIVAVAAMPGCVLAAAFWGGWWLASVLAAMAAATPWVLRSPVARSTSILPNRAEDALARALASTGDAVCLRLRLSDQGTGGPPDDTVTAARTARIARILRETDHLERQDRADIVIVLGPGPLPDLADLVQLAARVQGAAVAQDPDGDSSAVRLAATVGLCRAADLVADKDDLTRNPAARNAGTPTVPAMILDAAGTALADALSEGQGTIRVFARSVRVRQSRHAVLAGDAQHALASGSFTAWFQPQVSTDTGRISGFEALARWNHPEYGLVSPGDFLPVLQAAGLLERLGSVMLDRTLAALAAWDRAGFAVPSVGVNMSAADLRDPHLPQRIAWMLDRHDLHGQRLTIEILESVVAEGGAGMGDGPVLRNVAALAGMGCRIDLDDFGTGHASITSLHRLPVSRVKIDRSFVTGIDADRARQKMMMTILSMCDHLGLETVAEGVETRAEHAMLAQLGCSHVQGFGIGHPMPFDACCDWLRARNAELDAALRQIRRQP
jgi:EAL domain-containing protein (putative c-di-GMP-specific phosphodiesterase class I)